MSNTHSNGNDGFRLTFAGSMTIGFANELEDRILDAMRQHQHLEVDLSGVREIDLCGIHLIRLLQTVGGKAVHFIATSPIVEHALKGLRSTNNLTSRQYLAG
jgi:anti-anti-sigma regulatory factor